MKKILTSLLAMAVATIVTPQPAGAMAPLLLNLIPILIDKIPWAIDKMGNMAPSEQTTASRPAQYQTFQTADGIRLNCDVGNPSQDGSDRVSYTCTNQFGQTGSWAMPGGRQQTQVAAAPQETASVTSEEQVFTTPRGDTFRCNLSQRQWNGAQWVYLCIDQSDQKSWWASQ